MVTMNKSAFMNGFCQKMAELGIAPSELNDRIKRAGVGETLRDILGVAKGGLAAAGKGAFGVTLGLGGIAGYALGRQRRVTQENIDALQAELLAKEYADAAAEIRRENQERDRFGNKNIMMKLKPKDLRLA